MKFTIVMKNEDNYRNWEAVLYLTSIHKKKRNTWETFNNDYIVKSIIDDNIVLN